MRVTVPYLQVLQCRQVTWTLGLGRCWSQQPLCGLSPVWAARAEPTSALAHISDTFLISPPCSPWLVHFQAQLHALPLGTCCLITVTSGGLLWAAASQRGSS